MSLPVFVIVDGLLTVEYIPQPSWLIRRRVNDVSLTSEYGWVATMAQIEPGACEIKGYLAREAYAATASERRAIKRIGERLGFYEGRYDRVDTSGNVRAAIKMWGKTA